MNDYAITSVSGNKMLSQLPGYYEEIREMRVLAETEGQEIDQIQLKVNDVLNQYFVETATWGLSRWESEFGISPIAGQPADQRRSVIKSKIRGTGTVTVELIKNVAEAYDNGTVDVTQQPALYQFTVRFVDTRGLPPNLDDLKAAIEEMKPAHLSVVFEFTYTTWAELKVAKWGDLKTNTWYEVRTRSWS